MHSRGIALALRHGQTFIQRHSFAVVLVLAAAYAVYFSWFTILNHYTFRTNAYDLGLYMQSLWTTIHGYGLFYTTLCDGSRFAYHFEPILFALIPLYALSPRAETLLTLQSIALASGAVPVYLLARQRFDPAIGIGFAVLYLLSPAVHAVNSFDFHAVALAVPLLLFAHYCLSAGRIRTGVLLALVALTCRENVSLVVFMMGMYWAWRWRRQGMLSIEHSRFPTDHRFLVVACLALAALVWFLVSANVVIPHFALAETHPAFDRYYGALGNLQVDPSGKLLYLLQLLGPLGFLPLLSPGSLLIGSSAFAEVLLSIGPAMYSLTNHYVALLIPWLFLGAIQGLAVLGGRIEVGVIRLRRLVMLIMLAATAMFALVYGNSPISLIRGFPIVTDHVRAQHELTELIPDDATVFAQNNLFPHVCHRVGCYSIPFKFELDFFRFDMLYGRDVVVRESPSFDYVFMDTKSSQSFTPFIGGEAWNILRNEYELYAKKDGVLLYRRISQY